MKIFTLTLFTFIFGLSLQAQLFIEEVGADTMMMDFFNSDSVTVVSSSTIGSGSFSYFEGANTNIGVNAGIFLSTGDVFDAIGPNTEGGTSGTIGAGTDVDLNSISMADITEFSSIELDIVPTTNLINFKYVFASEEYPEFANSYFNDAFGFFVSGPGISGDFTNGAVNIVTLPDGTPVTINTVNNLVNPEYYLSNGPDSSASFSFDGFTVPLNASLNVIPGETYHVKITVGDVGDTAYDSGVFIDIESLGGDSLLIPPAQFSVTLDGNELIIDNASHYATSYLWDFGDGTTSIEKHPASHSYDVQTPTEYEISLTTQNYCCSDTYTTTVMAFPTTSTEQLIASNIDIFPNPAKDIINIKNFEQDGVVVLYNAFGQQVLVQNIAGDSQINIDELPQGVYLMNINDEKGIFNSRKLVIE